jgi:hypothetical protein
MKLDPDMHIGMHLVSFGKSGVTNGQSCKKKVNNDKYFETEGVLHSPPRVWSSHIMMPSCQS